MDALMEEYKLKKKTIGLLKDRDNNMLELKRLSAASARRLVLPPPPSLLTPPSD